MKKFFSLLFNIKFVSVMLAIFLWIYVISVKGPVSTRTLTASVTPINISPDLVLRDELPPVEITIKGPLRLIWSLKDEYFMPIVNMMGKREGSYIQDIEIRGGSLAEVETISIQPKTVKIVLEEVERVTFPINIEYKGEMQQGYFLGEVNIDKKNVVIEGPKSLISTIREAYIEIDLKGINKDVQQSFPIKIIDERKMEVKNIFLSPRSVLAYIPVLRSLNVSIVPVIPDLFGNLPKEYSLISIEVIPPFVTARGDEEILKKVSFLKTFPVDLSVIKESKEIETSLVLPEGLSLLEENQKIKIKLTVEENISRIFDNISIEKRNLAPGLVATLSESKINLVVYGPKSIVLKIDPTTISAYVDLSALKEGEYRLLVRVENIPSNVYIVSITPFEITVRIFSSR